MKFSEANKTIGGALAVYGLLLNLLIFALHTPHLAAAELAGRQAAALHVVCLTDVADQATNPDDTPAKGHFCPICVAAAMLKLVGPPPALVLPTSFRFVLLPPDQRVAVGGATRTTRNRGPPYA